MQLLSLFTYGPSLFDLSCGCLPRCSLLVLSQFRISSFVRLVCCFGPYIMLGCTWLHISFATSPMLTSMSTTPSALPLHPTSPTLEEQRLKHQAKAHMYAPHGLTLSPRRCSRTKNLVYDHDVPYPFANITNLSINTCQLFSLFTNLQCVQPTSISHLALRREPL